jgi:hypothetical protein
MKKGDLDKGKETKVRNLFDLSQKNQVQSIIVKNDKTLMPKVD